MTVRVIVFYCLRQPRRPPTFRAKVVLNNIDIDYFPISYLVKFFLMESKPIHLNFAIIFQVISQNITLAF